MGFWVALVCTLLSEAWVLRRLRFERAVIATVLAGTLLYAHYLSYTSISERNVDGSSHVAYVQAMARDLRPPDVHACGVCGHPPLYYALAAAWSRAGLAAGWGPFELVLQWFSLLSFFGFVVTALSIVRSRIRKPVLLWLATALIAFWPSSVINSVRVHNDALAAPLLLASMYFTARWDEDDRARDLAAALASAALALVTKSTGYAMAATLVIFALLKLRSDRWSPARVEQCAAVLLVLATSATLASAARESREPRTLCQAVLGQACGGRYVPPAPDTPSRFLSFDPARFVRRLDTIADDPSRDYFLNRFAKSSLFGMKPLRDELTSRRHRILGVVISSLLLAMIATCASALAFTRGEGSRRYRVYLVATALMLGLLLSFRLALPNPNHEDFRHVFPLLVPFCLAYVAAVGRLGRVHALLGKAGIVIGCSMVVASVAFFVRLP